MLLNSCSITEIFNYIVKLKIPIAVPTKKTKAEMETHPVIVDITINE